MVMQMVKLKAFDKFDNTSEALEAVAKLLEGAPSKGLRKFLKANCEGETLAVADSKLGNIIKEKLVCGTLICDMLIVDTGLVSYGFAFNSCRR